MAYIDLDSIMVSEHGMKMVDVGSHYSINGISDNDFRMSNVNELLLLCLKIAQNLAIQR